MKLAALTLAIVLSSCAVSHEAARSMKYAGIVLATGGALVVVDPLLNGDPLALNTTVAGNAIAVTGIVLGVLGVVLDPNNAAATK